MIPIGMLNSTDAARLFNWLCREDKTTLTRFGQICLALGIPTHVETSYPGPEPTPVYDADRIVAVGVEGKPEAYVHRNWRRERFINGKVVGFLRGLADGIEEKNDVPGADWAGFCDLPPEGKK